MHIVGRIVGRITLISVVPKTSLYNHANLLFSVCNNLLKFDEHFDRQDKDIKRFR